MTRQQLHLDRWVVALLALVLTATALPAAAQQVNWKMHVVWVPARPEAQAYQDFANLVNARAKGKLNITLYTGGSLGVKDVDMLRVLPADNVLQAAGLYPGYMSRDEPEHAITLPPGVLPDAESMVKALPALTRIYQATYDKWGVKLLGYVAHPIRNMDIMCKEPINSLAQLKGKKLRVWEKSQVDTFVSLGIAAQVIGQNDLYMAIKTGVVDCAVYAPALAMTISLQEVAPYAAYLFPYVLHPLNLIVSKKAFDALAPDVQKIVEDAAAEVQKKTTETYLKGEFDKIGEADFKKKGGVMLAPFSQADQSAFVKASREIWEKSAMEIGKNAQENRDAVLKAVAG
ncbi:MAG: TRAP transporter substrate-binding protein DctP [Betaproteobacteria bacterium]